MQRHLDGPENNLAATLGSSDIVHPAWDCGPHHLFARYWGHHKTQEKSEDRCNAIQKEPPPNPRPHSPGE